MYLTTTDFEGNDTGDWRPVNSAQAVTANVVADASAKQGRKVMRVSTTQMDGSVAHDVLIAGTVVRHVWEAPSNPPYSVYLGAEVAVVHSLQFSVWLRSADGQPNLQGALAIWDLDAAAELYRQAKDPGPAGRSTSFDVGGHWTQVSVAYDNITPTTYAGMSAAGLPPAPNNIRVEIYLKTLNRGLDVDAAVLI